MSKKSLFNKHIFIHTHIEKCGGSSLLRHMTTLLGQKKAFDLRSFPASSVEEFLKKYPDLKEDLSDIHLLSGHIWYNTPWAKIFSRKTFPYFQKRALYIASVRHPIERLNSFFRYLKANPKHPHAINNESVKNNDFDQFIQTLISSDHIKAKNEMCMQITRCRNPKNLIEKAKHSFDHNYFAIVPYNKTHELANIIAEKLELPKVENCIVNLNSSEKKITPNKETIALLEERCHDDITLYNYVCEKYQEKLSEAKNYLTRY